MRNAVWMPKATDIHSEYVTRIASPLQQWLLVRVSMLRYMYIACLVYSKKMFNVGYVMKNKKWFLSLSVLCEVRVWAEETAENRI